MRGCTALEPVATRPQRTCHWSWSARAFGSRFWRTMRSIRATPRPDSTPPGLPGSPSGGQQPTCAGHRATADVVIPFLHWGEQFESKPTEGQRRLARALLDAGANAVVGSHPHVVQGAETYKGRPIIYSLGDFIFDFEDPAKAVPEAQTGWILQLKVNKSGIVAWDTVIIRTDAAGLPQPVAGASDPKQEDRGNSEKLSARGARK